MKFIVEGLDRLGKGTLIENIIKEYGYHHVIHYAKPIKSKKYDESYQKYQDDSFYQGFVLLENFLPIIFDRFHLGECVYAHRYRGYSGDYVFETEKMFRAACDQTFMILLTTSDFNIMQDDGLSFDWSKREEEQQDFVNAFNKSNIRKKIKIDVANGDGGYRPADQIFAELKQFISRNSLDPA